MFRTIQGVIVVAAVLVIAATVVAVLDDKVANLLIGAAMVASNAAILGLMVDRRLGDAYDSGGRTQLRVLARELAGHTGRRTQD